MISFLPFKSKDFISLLSLRNPRTTQRKISILQTKKSVTYNEDTLFFEKEYRINNYLHREEIKYKRIMPAYLFYINKLIVDRGYYYEYEEWYKNGKIHREGYDYDGNLLPAGWSTNKERKWYKNGVEIKMN